MHVLLIMGLYRASTTLIARGPTYKPIPLVVLLHRLPSPSSELLAWTWTCIPAFSTMNSLARAVKMGWNPRANPAHHGFRQGWVEIFLQISIRVDF